MDEFDLALNFKGEDMLLPVRLMNYGTAYKLEVKIGGTKVLFEPDEERNWRAMISYEDVQYGRDILHSENVRMAINDSLFHKLKRFVFVACLKLQKVFENTGEISG